MADFEIAGKRNTEYSKQHNFFSCLAIFIYSKQLGRQVEVGRSRKAGGSGRYKCICIGIGKDVAQRRPSPGSVGVGGGGGEGELTSYLTRPCPLSLPLPLQDGIRSAKKRVNPRACDIKNKDDKKISVMCVLL